MGELQKSKIRSLTAAMVRPCDAAIIGDANETPLPPSVRPLPSIQISGCVCSRTSGGRRD
jgi:hypothetical protein